MRYYYANAQNQATGPVESAELARLLQAGVISPSTHVVEEGGTEWKPAATILPEFRAPSPPAEIPPIVAAKPAPAAQHEKGAFVVGVIALCFSAIAAAWSFVGGACCGWGGWGWAGIGLIMAIISLCLNKSKIGWWALALALFAFVWVFVSLFMIAGALGAAGASLNHH